jgi:hypothetical protein
LEVTLKLPSIFKAERRCHKICIQKNNSIISTSLIAWFAPASCSSVALSAVRRTTSTNLDLPQASTTYMKNNGRFSKQVDKPNEENSPQKKALTIPTSYQKKC